MAIIENTEQAQPWIANFSQVLDQPPALLAGADDRDIMGQFSGFPAFAK